MEKIKSIRLTPAESESVNRAAKKQSVKPHKFMKDAILEQVKKVL